MERIRSFLDNTHIKSYILAPFLYGMIVISLGYISNGSIHEVLFVEFIMILIVSYYICKYVMVNITFNAMRSSYAFVLLLSIIIILAANYNIRNSELESKGYMFFLAIPGTIIFSYYILNKVQDGFEKSKYFVINPCEIKAKSIQIFSFLFVFIPAVIIWANMYPGAMSPDGRGQLHQAVYLSGFENMNPFINTMFITLFVQIGMRIGGVAFGMALYLLFICSLYAFVWSYVARIMIERGLRKCVVVLTLLYAVWPINLTYVISMWKDTFFAILFLATIVTLLDLLTKKEIKLFHLFIFSLLQLMTALARNSGWSAFFVEAVVLSIYGTIRFIRDNNQKRELIIGIVQLLVVLFSIVVTFVIYPGFGIKSVGNHLTNSIQVQQISRVVVEENYSETEEKNIMQFGNENMMDQIKSKYRSNIVDPMRSVFNLEYIACHKKEFNKLWINLGLNHPKEYLYAYIDHTIYFWWPDARTWITDNRLWENEFGIERTPIFIPGKDIGLGLYTIACHIPKIYYLNNSGFTFLCIFLAMFLCYRNKSILGFIQCLPLIMIFIGLMMFAYCSDFRYTYASVLSLPMLILYVYCFPINN